MLAQHDHVRIFDFKHVLTRTPASNRPMTILNLECGFEIVGFWVNGAGLAVVNQRKFLDS